MRMKRVLVLVLAAVLVLGVFVPAAWAEDDMLGDWIHVQVKIRIGDEVRVEDYEGRPWWFGYGMAESYPAYELMEIDGVPWQDSPYREVIEAHLEDYIAAPWPSFFVRYPEMKNIVLDKRFNGLGNEAFKLYQQGKSVDEIEQILLKKSNGGSSGGSGDSSSGSNGGPEPPLPPVEPGKVKVVLRLGQKEYSVSKGDTWNGAYFDVAPFSDSGRTLVPLRGVMEQFGAKVDWDAASKRVTVSLGGRKVVLTVGSREALVNGQAVQLDVPAKVVNGRTMIPLRFVSENIGMKVTWEAKTQSVTIEEK